MKNLVWRRVMKRGGCAAGSIRSRKVAGGKVLRFCCPKGPGHWRKNKCKVGTRLYEVGTPKRTR